MPIRFLESLAEPPGGARFYLWGDSLRERESQAHSQAGDQGIVLWTPEPGNDPEFSAVWERANHKPSPWFLGKVTLDWQRPYIMGVLNITPDSFSDGGMFDELPKAVEQALEMIKGGADLIDVGGESTRPGARPISVEEELRRVIPVIEELREFTDAPISIDTNKAAVAEEALKAGANIINDISAGADPQMFSVLAQHSCPVILMHRQGTPETMQQEPHYNYVVDEVYEFLAQRIETAQAAGIARKRISIDPGIGFGKTVAHNLELLRRLGEFRSLGCPILIGTSRKSFIGKVLGLNEPKHRVWGTAATTALALAQGAHIFRVHDVAMMTQVIRMAQAVLEIPPREREQ
jgi:dihydropteroate synthase